MDEKNSKKRERVQVKVTDDEGWWAVLGYWAVPPEFGVERERAEAMWCLLLLSRLNTLTIRLLGGKMGLTECSTFETKIFFKKIKNKINLLHPSQRIIYPR